MKLGMLHISKCLILRLAPNLVLHTTHPPAFSVTRIP